jgi:hypothetical protein
MKSTDDFVDACIVYFGEQIPVEDAVIPDLRTPETILIEKDTILSLSRECEILKEVLLNLPEEMYLSNGRVKRTALKKALKIRTGWTNMRISQVEDKLKTALVN